MVIEWLQFRVDETAVEEFIERDREIWTAALEQYPGFIKKEVWTNPNDPAQVIVIVYWQTIEQWHAIPADALAVTEAEFNTAMGDGQGHGEAKRYELVTVNTYTLADHQEPQLSLLYSLTDSPPSIES